MIWFDETEGGDSSDFTIPEIVISPLAKGNAYDGTLLYTHSSDLKTMEELFGVSALGRRSPEREQPGHERSVGFVRAEAAFTPAPEPSTLILAGFATIGGLFIAYRRRRA